MKYSIVIGFKDRELARVERCLDSLRKQNFKEFELLFINYGSRPELTSQLEELFKSYNFAHHIYCESRGLVWNRSHALNIGIKRAKGEYVITTDVDMIFLPDFLQKITNYAMPDCSLHSKFYLLPPNFSDWNNLQVHQGIADLSSEAEKGGVHVLHRKIYTDLNGFDEFYKIWGVEDRDLEMRLENLGIHTKWVDQGDISVFHQWHPKYDINWSDKMPGMWWEEMNFHFYSRRFDKVRNKEWGKILFKEDRPALLIFENTDAHVKDLPITSGGVEKLLRGFVLINILKELEGIQKGQGIRFKIEKRKSLTSIPYWHILVIKSLQKVADFLKVPLKIFHRWVYDFLYDEDKFRSYRDIKIILWFLIQKMPDTIDYYFEENDELLGCIIAKRK